MATVRTTIGTIANQNVNIQSVVGAGPWDITLAAPAPSDTKVGDTLSDEAAAPNLYLITVVNGSTLTVRNAFGALAAPSNAGTSQAFTKRSYSTITLWNAKLDDTDIYDAADDAEGAICETLTVTATQNITGGGTIGLNSIALLGHESYRHSGLPGAGVAVNTTEPYNVVPVKFNTAVTCYLQWLIVSKLPVAGAYHTLPIVQHAHATGILYVENCLIYGNKYGAANGGDNHGIWNSTEGGVLHVRNTCVWGIGNATTATGSGVYFSYAASSSTCYNVTVYDVLEYGVAAVTANIKVQNTIALDSGTADFYNPNGWHASSNYNASSDVTSPGANSLDSQVAADTFVDEGNGDFHLEVTAESLGAGINLTGLDTRILLDIDGESRPSAGVWDIGADGIPPVPQEFAPYQKEREMFPRQVDTTGYPITFFMVDELDHITGLTGLSPTITISKNAGAFAPAVGAITEIGVGWYSWTGNADDRDTEGDIAVHVEAVGADPVDFKMPIVVHDPFDETAGGGTATIANQNTMIGYLEDIMGTGFVTGTHSLDQTADTDTLVDAVYDENIVSAHGTANTSGYLLRCVGAAISNRSFNANLNALLGVPDEVAASVVSEVASTETVAPDLLHSTSLLVVASQTSMRLSSGSTDDDAYTNCLAVFTDQITSNQKATCRITNYSGASKTITLEEAPAFIVEVGDSISIIAQSGMPLSTATIGLIEDAVLNDDATARTTANSIGKAVNSLTTLAARANNPNLNALLGVADQAGLTATPSIYFCRFQFLVDDVSSRDEYRSIRWYKNDTPLDSGVTDPKIRVINADTGADLIAETALSEAGSSHLFMYNAVGAQRISTGQAYAVRFKATIDAAVRVFEDRIGKDREAG